jgi:hypothetical protein
MMATGFNEVIKSLRDEPEMWKYDPFILQHSRLPVSVWHANETYGMHISYRGAVVWGGATLLSSVGLSWRHHRLRSEVDKWLNARLSADFAHGQQ